MNSPTMNSPILRMANSTPAIRGGFFAAGLTVAGVAIMQAFSTIVAWVASAFV